MKGALKSTLIALASCGVAWAGVIPSVDSHSEALDAQVQPVRASVTSLDASQLAAITPFVEFARVAYCPSEKLEGWGCGGNARTFMRLHM